MTTIHTLADASTRWADVECNPIDRASLEPAASRWFRPSNKTLARVNVYPRLAGREHPTLITGHEPLARLGALLQCPQIVHWLADGIPAMRWGHLVCLVMYLPHFSDDPSADRTRLQAIVDHVFNGGDIRDLMPEAFTHESDAHLCVNVQFGGPMYGAGGNGGGVQQAAREIAAVLNREGDRLALHPLLTKSP